MSEIRPKITDHTHPEFWAQAPKGTTHWEAKAGRWLRIANGVIFDAQFCRQHSWDRTSIPMNHDLIERPAAIALLGKESEDHE